MKIKWEYNKAKCPFCNNELYALSVFDVMKKGGICPFCGKAIEKDD